MKSVQKIVTKEDLHNVTLDGWEVVERFEIDDCIETQKLYYPEYQNGYQPSPVQRTDYFVGKRSYFRMSKSEESMIAELNGKLSYVEIEMNKLQKIIVDMERDRDTTAKKLDVIERNEKSLKDDIARLRNANSSLESAKRALEIDIGKVREHVGKKTMDEILNTSK